PWPVLVFCQIKSAFPSLLRSPPATTFQPGKKREQRPGLRLVSWTAREINKTDDIYEYRYADCGDMASPTATKVLPPKPMPWKEPGLLWHWSAESKSLHPAT